MSKIILLISFFLIQTSCFTQNFQQDSSQIEKLFTGILIGTSRDSSLFELKQVKTNNKDNIGILEIYDFYFAKFLMQSVEMDSAIVISQNALKKYNQLENSGNQINFLKIIASCYAYNQDYQQGIIYFKKALIIAEETNHLEQAAYINNNIANLFFSLMDFESAYKYSSASFSYLKNHPENPYYASILAILSMAESKTQYKEKAYHHATEALEIATKTNNILALIVANHALGDIEGEQNNYKEAIKWFSKSLEISEQYHQLNLSLLNHIGLLPCYIGLGEYEGAIYHGEEALIISKKTGNKNVTYSLKRKLAMAYHKSGQDDKAFTLMHDAHEIYKATTSFETQESINEILIKYDTEKKEKEIQKNKVKLMHQEVESGRFRFIIALLVFILLLFFILYLFIQHKNKRKLIDKENELEKEILRAVIEGEEKERERLSSDLHDGIASTLTSIRFKMENSKDEQSTEIIQMIRDAQIDTRRISHNLSPLKIENEGIQGAMKQFAQENSNESTKIHFSNFCSAIQLNKDTELMIYRIVQELVQNSTKHGNAKNIDIQFMSSENEFNWSIEDDGKGFNVKGKPLGQGLLSIKNRIERMNGDFNIDSSYQGTIVQLSIPF